MNQSPDDLYYNREISWLEFNKRVLLEALNDSNPLLERVRFLSISASNLDEFYRVRMAGIKTQIALGVTKLSADGQSPTQQRDLICSYIEKLIKKQNHIWQILQKQIKQANIELVTPANIQNKTELQWIKRTYQQHIKPNIQQYSLHNTMPAPFIPNGAMAILASSTKQSGDQYLLRLSRHLPRFIRLSRAEPQQYIKLEDVISYFMEQDQSLKTLNILRFLRDGDLVFEQKAEDLLLTFQNALKKRSKQAITIIKHSGILHKNDRSLLSKLYHLEKKDFFSIHDMPIGLAHITQLIPKGSSSFTYPPFKGKTLDPTTSMNHDIFKLIKQKDLLLHHPYESFDPVITFLNQAADDPNVISIQQSLYRTNNNSPIVDALKRATQKGKKVSVVIELKARFDEANNVNIARDLKKLGAHILFGDMRLKTHAKFIHIHRRENGKIAHYSHIGTGNYHPQNAKIYTDISYFTACPDIGCDIDKIFDFITNKSASAHLSKLYYSPHTIYPKLCALIDQEIDNAQGGKPAYIWAKMNALIDTSMIQKLYKASQAGVHICLNIRGTCALKAGIKGMSENIHVDSVIGQFLEHSRLFAFANGHLPFSVAHSHIYISSADWMHRNLHRRIEIMAPIEDPELKQRLFSHFIAIYDQYHQNAWKMQADGCYTKKEQQSFNKTKLSAQEEFIHMAKDKG